ncbi:MAG: respiratory nitrate reductase subunit gamma [Anaerolineae bacterium]|nr:respiratory nitrate reductase subunit gamma [Anaerolineae bacterium]
MSRLTVFWVCHLLAMAVLVAGLALRVSIWLEGQVEGRAPAGVRRGIGAGWRFLRRAGLRRTLRALVLDGLLHRRLWAQDRYRWLAHACLLGGFSALAVLSTLTGFAQEVLLGLLRVDHPLVQALVNKDGPVVAVLNETLGLIMVIGLAMMAMRRYVRRPDRLRTGPVDTALIALLAVTLLTGYPVEALRLLTEQVPPALARYSYVGYLLSLPLRSQSWPWEVLHYWTFLFHSLLASAFLAYIPFSKLFHALVSPLVAAANSVGREVQAT